MKRSMLSTALAAGLLCFSMSASAGFSGYYAPSQWMTGHTVDDFGSVDTSGAPAGSITLIGSDSNSLDFPPSRVDFTIVAQGAGTFSFDWSYSTTDSLGPFYDRAGYIKGTIAAGQFQLTNNLGLSTQSGQSSFLVAAGDVIGFHVTTLDNYGGSASLTISNFSAPVPEPTSVAMMALGLLGLAGATAARRRRQG